MIIESVYSFIGFNAYIIKFFLIVLISCGLVFVFMQFVNFFFKTLIDKKILAILFFTTLSVMVCMFFSITLFESAVTVFSLGTLFLLPGCIAGCTLIKLEDHDFFERLFLIISISTVISSMIGLLLSFSGHFTLYASLFLIWILSILFYVFRRTEKDADDIPQYKKIKGKKIRSGKETFLILAILLFSILLFFHPFEYIWGGADAGVYLNTGANIAKTGSIWIQDPAFQLLDSSNVQYFFGRPFNGDTVKYEGSRFPGFYIDSFSKGIVIPQFLYLYPVWIAFFYSFGGIYSSLYVVPVFAILSVLAIFFMTKRIFNVNIAALTIFLLIINLQQLWSARMSLSEIIVQFFLFFGLYMFYRYYSYRNIFFLVFSAVAVGLTFFTRIDSLLLLPVVCLMMVLLHLQSKDNTIQNNSVYSLDFFAIPAITMIIASFITSLYFSRPYIFDAMKFPAGITPITFYFIVSCLLAGFYLVLKLNYPMKYFEIKGIMFNKRLPMIFSITTIIVFVFLYYIRPEFMGSDYVISGTKVIKLYSNENFIRLSWYLSQIGLIFSFAGIIFLVNKEYKKGLLLLVSFAVPFVYYMINIQNNPFHIYAFRRLLPVVIPIMTIFIGYFCIGIYNLKNSAKESKKFSYLSVFFIVTIFLSLLSITAPMLTHVEFQGAVQAVSGISNLTPSTDTNPVIYFQDDMTYEYLATPLTYYFDKITLKIPINNKESVEDHLLRNDNSYLITKSGSIPIIDLNNLTKIDDYSINEPMYEKSYTTLPTNITRFRTDISIYKIKNDSF